MGCAIGVPLYLRLWGELSFTDNFEGSGGTVTPCRFYPIGNSHVWRCSIQVFKALGHTHKKKKKKKKNVLFPETWNVFHGSVGQIIIIFFWTSKHVFFSHN